MNKKIVITGAAGFIGSCLAGLYNSLGATDLILVDDFSRKDKLDNFSKKKYSRLIDREIFIDWLNKNYNEVEVLLHIGARTDTTEFNMKVFDKLNINYTKDLWNLCTQYQIPFIYASSAATYGLGELGYEDKHEIVGKLKPLNPYGDSKNLFDIWALQQVSSPPLWYGLKFFNVYGPNEYHKGRMASVIFHAFNQIKQRGFVNLFQSHRPDFKHGMQLRDFVYVKDVVSVISFLIEEKPENGLYNLGTGKARTFYDLAANTFNAQGLVPDIRFIPTPEDIRDKYQYFTEANMHKLRSAGYKKEFYSLEEGIHDYVQNYLLSSSYY
jgi:ADP-L-glycero-D-manno-heptose 6-epimerase